MINDSLVSVIIPVYNVSKYIRYTIDSVLSQDYKLFEIIIIDDGSTDNSCEIIEQIAENFGSIRLFKKAHSGNVGKNLNFGIEQAKGDLIAVLGADDLWKKNKLSIQTQNIKFHNIICSNGFVIDEKNEIISEQYVKNFFENTEFNLCSLLEENNIIASSVIGYKSIFTENGGFEEEIGIRGEDYSLWLKIAEKNHIFFINENLVSYRVHGKNLSTINVSEKIELYENTIRIREPYLKHSDHRVFIAARLGICDFLKQLCKIYYFEKEYLKAYNCAKRFLNLYPKKFEKLYFKIFIFLVFMFCLKTFKIWSSKH